MAKNGSSESKASIIGAVSDWLKLLALIVLVSEGVLAAAYYSTKDTDPFRKYFFPLMIAFLALIVVGVFVDRALVSRAPYSQASAADGTPRQVALVSRWYFKSGITEEELNLTIIGNRVTGKRTTRHPKGKEMTYAVTGWHHTSTFWLEYHDMTDQYGGGSMLLDEFTNDRLSGMILSKDCNTGTMQCRANMWLPSKLKKDHQAEFFKFIGAIDRTELLRQASLAS
jgi:hypothetical protein